MLDYRGRSTGKSSPEPGMEKARRGRDALCALGPGARRKPRTPRPFKRRARGVRRVSDLKEALPRALRPRRLNRPRALVPGADEGRERRDRLNAERAESA